MIGATGRLDCDRCDGEIGCDPWDGVARLAGHELGEGESEQRERKRAEQVGGGWRGGWGWVAGDGGTAESEQRVRSRAERRE